MIGSIVLTQSECNKWHVAMLGSNVVACAKQRRAVDEW